MDKEYFKEISSDVKAVKATLASMNRNKALVIWCLVFIAPLLLALEGLIQAILKGDVQAFLVFVIITAVFVVGVFLYKILHKKKNYVMDLIENSSKLGVVTNEREFLRALEESLTDGNVCKKKLYAITGYFFISWGENDYEFKPVAFPRNQIRDIKIANELVQTLKSVHNIVVLEISLYNGHVARCCVASRNDAVLDDLKKTIFADIKKNKQVSELLSKGDDRPLFDEAERRAKPIPLPFDFAKYEAVIVMHQTGIMEVEKLLSKYEEIYNDDFKFVIRKTGEYDSWTSIKAAYNKPLEFWDYENLILWLSQKDTAVFGFAWGDEYSLFSEPDIKDKFGESLILLHNKSTLKFNVPENQLKRLFVFENGSTPEMFIKMKYHFDVEWLKR